MISRVRRSNTRRTRVHGGKARRNRKHQKKTMRKRRRRSRRGGSRRQQRGGYSQYMSNKAWAHGYALGGKGVGASNSALANPPPYHSYMNCKDPYGVN